MKLEWSKEHGGKFTPQVTTHVARIDTHTAQIDSYQGFGGKAVCEWIVWDSKMNIVDMGVTYGLVNAKKQVTDSICKGGQDASKTIKQN